MNIHLFFILLIQLVKISYSLHHVTLPKDLENKVENTSIKTENEINESKAVKYL